MNLPLYELVGGPLKQPRPNGKRSKNYQQKYRLIDEETGKISKVKCASLRTTDISVARKRATQFVEAKIRRDITENDPTAEHKHKNFEQHFADFVADHKAANYSEKHHKALIARIKVIGENCKFKKIEQIEPVAIRAYLAKRRNSGQTGEQGLIHYRTAIKQFVNWLVENDRLPRNVLAKLKAKPNGDAPIQQRKRIFTDEEAEKLIAHVSTRKVCWKMTGKERAILYLTAMQTGFRAQELASITPACCFLDDDRPFIRIDCRRSKRRKYDEQRIQPELAAMLQELCEGKREKERLWPSSWWQRSKEMLKADLPPDVVFENRKGQLAFHSFRHTFNTRIFGLVNDVALAMEICRLSSLALVKRYHHPDEDKIASTIQALPSPQLPTAE